MFWFLNLIFDCNVKKFSSQKHYVSLPIINANVACSCIYSLLDFHVIYICGCFLCSTLIVKHIDMLFSYIYTVFCTIFSKEAKIPLSTPKITLFKPLKAHTTTTKKN